MTRLGVSYSLHKVLNFLPYVNYTCFLNAPEEARIPDDERDRDIHRRSITVAYSVLIFGMIFVGVVMPFNYQGWTIINSTLLTIIAAEIVHYSVVIFCYRRQS